MAVEIVEDYTDLDITKLKNPPSEFHLYNADTRDDKKLRWLLRRGYTFASQEEAKRWGLAEIPQFQDQLKGLGFAKEKKSSNDGFVHVSPDLVLMKIPMDKFIRLTQQDKSILAKSAVGAEKKALEQNFKNMDAEAIAALGDDGRGIPGTTKKYVNQTISSS